MNQKNQDGTTKTNTYCVAVPYTRSYKRLKTYSVVENISYIGQFDTTDKHLYTVEQKVNGELVTYNKDNDTEMSRESFSKDINLEVTFDGPEEIIYVENSLKLGEVSLTGSSFGADGLKRRVSDEFTIESRSLNYFFRFNGGEKVTVSTVYEKLLYGDEELAHSSIDNISYKTYEAKLNESKTNEGYITYDITLYFSVKLKIQDQAGIAQYNTYSVTVPYTRAFKHIKN